MRSEILMLGFKELYDLGEKFLYNWTIFSRFSLSFLGFKVIPKNAT